ncbi:MAG: hypothetical protein HQL95_00640 [Magnetococcales bacterium]|nr:hypothetical protein [Magnetococcales bacterium]
MALIKVRMTLEKGLGDVDRLRKHVNQGVKLGGRFSHQVFRHGKPITDEEWSDNIVPDQMLNYSLDTALRNQSPRSNWYVGLFSGNVVPGATLTGATVDAVLTEITAYTSATRIPYLPAAATGKILTNATSKAEFTINASVTAYGAFLVSHATKGDTTSTTICAAASKFTTQRTLVDQDQLLVTYQITASST